MSRRSAATQGDLRFLLMVGLVPFPRITAPWVPPGMVMNQRRADQTIAILHRTRFAESVAVHSRVLQGWALAELGLEEGDTLNT